MSTSSTTAEYHAASRSGGRVAVRDDRALNQVSRWRSTKQDVAGGPVVNEVVNPSFETGAISGGWTNACGTGSTCAVGITAQDRAGPGRHAATATITDNGSGGSSYSAWSSSRTPVTAGDTVYVRAQAKLVSGNWRLSTGVHVYHADSSSAGTSYPSVVDDLPLGQWVTLRGSYTVPDDVAEVRFRTSCGGSSIPAGGSATIQFDRAMLVVNPPAANPTPSYVDGDAPGGQWLAGGQANGKSEGVPIDWQ